MTHDFKSLHEKFDIGIFWCRKCNIPLLQEQCGICHEKGIQVELTPPGDVRFASPHEHGIIDELVFKSFGKAPLSGKLMLLNKIPGEDKTDEIIVDGLRFGILRFDMKELVFKLDLLSEGARALIDSGIRKKIVKISSKGGHLSGKNLNRDAILECSDDIVKGDAVLVISGNLRGFGLSYRDSKELKKQGPSIKIKKIDSGKAAFLQGKSSRDKVIRANAPHMRQLVKDAVNTIRGIANQKEFKDSPVYVSFSGGKDSLTTLDLTRSAVKKPIKVFFANTGIEFPETVEFIRRFCKDNNIELIEVEVKDAFWENLPSFGPPAKDFRWCCKVCKLAPINTVMEECTRDGKCLTIDGKRKYESFARSRIAPKEENPFIPGQVSVFPIRNWRSIEVWLYLYYRKLEYNPLYDQGFERVGCWLCPAELSAEYYRFKELHPELFTRWNDYLLDWAGQHGLDDKYVDHGFWRWKSLPPKMVRLSRELGINTSVAKGKEDAFSIVVTGGISPCKTGGYTMEGKVTGIIPDDAQNIANMLGENVFSEDLGVLLIRTNNSNIKIFSSGHISVNAKGREEALSLFEKTAKQLIREKKCTKCGICLKVCPVGAIALEPKLKIGKECTRCWKCMESCVVVKYFDRLLPGFRK